MCTSCECDSGMARWQRMRMYIYHHIISCYERLIVHRPHIQLAVATDRAKLWLYRRVVDPLTAEAGSTASFMVDRCAPIDLCSVAPPCIMMATCLAWNDGDRGMQTYVRVLENDET